MRIYIAGPMSGLPEFNYPVFHETATKLRAQGHFVVNPTEIGALFGSPEEIDESCKAARYGDEDIGYTPDEFLEDAYAENLHKRRLFDALETALLAAVRSCDAIFLMDGWEGSTGAKKELGEALANKLQVFHSGCLPSCALTKC